MPTYSIPLGMPTTLTQNQIYALPSRACYLFSDATTPTIQQSSDVGFTANTAVTLTNGQAGPLAGGFIRSTAGNISVVLKAA